MRTEISELERLARRTLDLAERLGDEWRPQMGALTPASGAYPPVPGVEVLRRSQEATLDAADLAVRCLLAVLEGDADRVWRAATAYADADHEAARHLRHRAGERAA